MTGFRIKQRRPVFRGRVIDVGVEVVELPNGRLAELEIIRHPGGIRSVVCSDSISAGPARL